MVLISRIIFLFLFILKIITANELGLNLEYSTNGLKFLPFGKLLISQNFQGNYTGTVKLESGIEDVLFKSLKESASKNGLYYLKSKDFLTSNSACLLLRSDLAHLIAVTIDQERGSLESLTLFPDGIYDAGIGLLDCSDFDAEKPAKVTAKVIVTTVQELPSPDTVTYLQRLEEEKRSRQHGAAQDNRSFLAKYWMYIVPVVIFMVVSGAMGGEEGGPSQ